MIYIDVDTFRDIGSTLKRQKAWLDENGITKVKHIATRGKVHTSFGSGQYNRWRFEDEADAMAFKIFWGGDTAKSGW